MQYVDADPVAVDALGQGGYTLRWPGLGGGLVTVYAGEHPDAIDLERPLAATEAGEVTLTLPAGKRHYFLVRPEHGTAHLLAERRIPLVGSPNFRDMGGYVGHEGRAVRWGQLYRSGRLSALSREDIDHLAQLGISLVFDFRYPDEQQRAPSAWPEHARPDIRELHIIPGSAQSFFEGVGDGVTADDMARFMVVLNEELATGQQERYRSMFHAILEADNPRLLMHCSAGKDRTGFGAALLLSALGVSREQIMRDYLLTNRCLPIDKELARAVDLYSELMGQPLSVETLRPMFEVRPEYLQAGFDAIDAQADSTEEYLAQYLNVGEAERRELRSRYLAR